MHRRVLTVAVCVLLAASAREALAQAPLPWGDRGYVNVNVGFESTSGTLNDATTFRLYGEDGTKRVQGAVDSGPLFDFSAGWRVWRNVSAGIGYHRETTTGQATLEASVPHPIFFNQNRAVALTVSELKRVERAIHLQFGYMLPFDERLSVHVFAGPSFFRLTQNVVGDVTFTEQPPAFTSVGAAATVIERKRSRTGGSIGVDVGYKLYESGLWKLGAGMFLRYSGTTAAIEVLANQIESDLGGLQIGFGGRVRF